MPAYEALRKHENECCVLKWILVVKKDIAFLWDSQKPFMHEIHKDKVLITSWKSDPAGPPQAGLSNIEASDFLFS